MLIELPLEALYLPSLGHSLTDWLNDCHLHNEWLLGLETIQTRVQSDVMMYGQKRETEKKTKRQKSRFIVWNQGSFALCDVCNIKEKHCNRRNVTVYHFFHYFLKRGRGGWGFSEAVWSFFLQKFIKRKSCILGGRIRTVQLEKFKQLLFCFQTPLLSWESLTHMQKFF